MTTNLSTNLSTNIVHIIEVQKTSSWDEVNDHYNLMNNQPKI